MNGQVGILLDQKSDAKVMPKIRRHPKTDVRFWKEVIFRRKRGTEEDQNWTAQIQYLKRREQFPLDTPNKDAAATKARDIYLSLHSRGWEETLAIYKPQPEVVEVKPERSTIGDLIREVSATTNYRVTTFSVYCAALRRIAADLLNLQGEKSRFCAKGKGNQKWRALVDATRLDLFTAEAIQGWKLRYLNKHKDSPADYSRAVNTVNAHLRNARSLFTTKALEFAKKRLDLPDPLPFSTVKLERRRATTRYSSRIDPQALIRDAKNELCEVPERREQFKIFCLALLCGLRKREIDTLLWSSVDFEKQVIRIERTRYFQPKSEESAAEVDLALELAALFKIYHDQAKGEFVIESANPPRYHISRANYRAERDFQALYAWLESKGVSARKKLHELRKECGSVIANSMGIFAASRALRHSDIRVTSQYYSDKKVRITTGLDSLLSSPSDSSGDGTK